MVFFGKNYYVFMDYLFDLYFDKYFIYILILESYEQNLLINIFSIVFFTLLSPIKFNDKSKIVYIILLIFKFR